jgi:hormone-sensitive lipase
VTQINFFFYYYFQLGKSSDSSPSLPPSPCLIVHCHGGGFVAQSSRSHECYLRDWATRLNVPIISIDYSLAPSAPFPRALEEALYAYCWARQNCQLLGSTGERVILVGDSAGANLNLGVTLKCIDMGLPLPHGMFLAYVPVLVAFIPSPARLLCLMDPLLPFGFMMRCLKGILIFSWKKWKINC